MKKLEFKRIGLLIGLTLLVTLAIQTWRIGTQWEILKSELQQDIQQGFDRAVENYYADEIAMMRAIIEQKQAEIKRELDAVTAEGRMTSWDAPTHCSPFKDLGARIMGAEHRAWAHRGSRIIEHVRR